VRVIAGEFRSRKLLSLTGLETRPTPDRLRQTLFNILGPAVEDAVFVDAYAGTGAVGIEALSRGARRAVFLEKDRRAVEVIQQNLSSLGLQARSRVIQGAAAAYLSSLDADVVFLDPPYPKKREYQAALEALGPKPPALTVVQHSVRFSLAEEYGPLRLTRTLKQGDNVLSFFCPGDLRPGDLRPGDQAPAD
jgi:16S rRNA (guanine966-N2)-methyltransferase